MDYTDIPGWFDFGFLYAIAVDTAKDGDSLVELGAYFGRSTVFMAQRIRDSKKALRFYTVDFWGRCPDNDHNAFMTDDIYEQFLANLDQCAVSEFVQPLRGATLELAAHIPNELHFCFIDACHTYEAVRSDIQMYLPKVRSGGILAGHDYPHPPVRKAVDETLVGVEDHGSTWVYRKP